MHPTHVGNLAVSPDGRRIAFTTDQAVGDKTPVLSVVSTEGGGQPREVFRSKETEPFRPGSPLAWSSDWSHLIFGTSSYAKHPRELWKIPVEGGKPEKLGVAMPGLKHLRVSKDGKRIAFDAGQRKIEIWRMENLLPKLQASR